MKTIRSTHPVMLWVLSFIEIWDRFSYYGIQAILMLYLTKIFNFTDHQAYTFYGVYTTLAYGLPILGGYVADKYLGHERSIIIGLVLASLGSLVLAQHKIEFIYVGIALFIIGAGLCKPNNASVLESNYSSRSSLRESGFVLFYAAMNIGAILGPLIFGLLTTHLHWSWSFYLSALGLAISLIVFLRKYKNTLVFVKHPSASKKTALFATIYFFIMLLAIILLFKHPYFLTWLIIPAALLSLLFLFSLAFKQNNSQKYKLFSLIIFIVFSLFFFSCVLQLGSSITLFIDRFLDRNIFGYTVPTATFLSLEPLFVVLSSLLFSSIFNRSKCSLSFLTYRIFAGIMLAGLSFVCFSLVAYCAEHHIANYSLLFGIVVGNAFLGVGELCIAPALISAILYLAPESKKGTFMGFWYFSIAFSGYVASLMAKLNATEKTLTAAIFSHNFFIVGLFIFGVGILFFCLIPLLNRWIQATEPPAHSLSS